MNPPQRREPRSPEYARLADLFPLEPIDRRAHFEAAWEMFRYVASLVGEDPGVLAQANFRAAWEMLSRVADRDEGDPGVLAYFRVLSRLLGDYGATHCIELPEGAVDFEEEFEVELATYKRLKPGLLAHDGKYVIVVGQDLDGPFDDVEAAMRFGYAKYGSRPFLTRLIQAVTPVVYL